MSVDLIGRQTYPATWLQGGAYTSTAMPGGMDPPQGAVLLHLGGTCTMRLQGRLTKDGSRTLVEVRQRVLTQKHAHRP
eukprot:3498410-Prymnesium_polylepis.1